MRLTRIEQETIINYNQGEDTASIYTHDPKMLRKMAQFAREDSTVVEVKHSEDWVEYYFPKRWVKIQRPRVISEENRQLMAERARKNFVKKGGEGNGGE